MRITILGGGGFLGRRLASRLARDGALGDRPIEALTLFDLAEPPAPEGARFPVHRLAGDVADPAQVAAAIPPGTGVVVHLAAVVSAQAEADFDLGLRQLGSQAIVIMPRRAGSWRRSTLCRAWTTARSRRPFEINGPWPYGRHVPSLPSTERGIAARCSSAPARALGFALACGAARTALS